MNKYLIATGVATAAAAGLLLAPSAVAAESAAVTIGQLEAQGFDVKVDRIGSAPLSECEVTGIRNARVRRSHIIFDRDSHNPFDFQRRTVTVSLNCAR
ncbi:hypothetical protein [Mycolicibacterium mengxianglii]|uniref:hypothetical protein n=1 Tax=Mycolicibacterium mengxianglii TaxID=2736649 RepID=UPI0018D17C97|nr:hypothetical protein [Mycolicibacterium mengxianglii]